MKRTADVIVVGLGVDGSSTAWNLAKRGADVIGIEQYWRGHTNGSSHGESRITRLACGEGSIYTPLASRSLRAWEELERTFNMRGRLYKPTGGLLIGLNGGSGEFHGKRNFVGRTIDHARRYNVQHRIHSWNDISSVFPAVHARMDEYGYYEPEAGVLFPENCVRTLQTAAHKSGAKLHYNTRVHDIRQENDRVIVSTDCGEFSAKRCVIAAGAFVKRFLPEPYRKLFKVERQVMFWYKPRRLPDYFTADRFPILIWERLGFYAFPDLGNGLVKVARDQSPDETDPEHVERDVYNTEYAEMEKVLSMGIPDMAGERAKAVTCLYTRTPDKNFIIDRHPEMDGVVVVSACSGHGFKHAPAVGDIAARMALNEDSEFNLDGFSFNRFRDVL